MLVLNYLTKEKKRRSSRLYKLVQIQVTELLWLCVCDFRVAQGLWRCTARGVVVMRMRVRQLSDLG